MTNMTARLPNILTTMVVEVRPVVQSVNVSITLKEDISTISVELSEHNFQLVVNDQEIFLPLNGYVIVKDSLLQVYLSNRAASYRFSIKSCIDKIQQELLTQFGFKYNSNETFLNRDICYRIKCVNCSNDLSNDVYFTRVLPLPSENVEPSEWFCHPPNSNSSVSLSPKITDIFYSHCYAHVNANIARNTRIGNRIIVCNKCLCWLGIMKNTETMKLWYNTVGFSDGRTFHKSDALNDMFVTIKEALKHPVINNMKFVFVCESAKDRCDYFLLWILEKKLNLFLYADSECQAQDFKEQNVAKVLFKHENSQSELVQTWMNDVKSSVISISKPMAHAFITHLYKYNKIIPAEFNKSGEFLVSYLFMY